MLLTMALAVTLAPETFRLWDGDAPGALGKNDWDIPTITLYRPEKPNGMMIVVCPGGGYGALADHEGAGYAQFLNRFGITAGVLKYRLGSHGYRHPVMLWDAARAMRFSREHASSWGIDRMRVGIMGSSAGGHLASTLLTHFDGGDLNAKDKIELQSSRPDFGILCYAVITMGEYTHVGSRTNLLGDNPSSRLITDLSNERQVTSDTPPCFIWCTADDPVVPARNSLMFAEALGDKKIPFELHIYPHGAHGLGLGGPPDSDHLLPWTTELIRWLGELKK